MTTPLLITDLERDEGFRALPYRDGGGVWTQGFGDTRGVGPNSPPVTEAEALATLQANVAATLIQLDKALPWWRTLNDTRQDVIAEMAFNLGATGLCEFKKMLADVEAGRFGLAAAQMLMSAWAKEVGDRAMRLSILMEHGART